MPKFIQCKKCFTKKIATQCNQRSRICHECISISQKKVRHMYERKVKVEKKHIEVLDISVDIEKKNNKYDIIPGTAYCYTCDKWIKSIDAIYHVRTPEHVINSRKKIIEHQKKHNMKVTTEAETIDIAQALHENNDMGQLIREFLNISIDRGYRVKERASMVTNIGLEYMNLEKKQEPNAEALFELINSIHKNTSPKTFEFLKFTINEFAK